MITFLTRITIALFFISPTFAQNSEVEWCVADSQFPDPVLQAAMDWACKTGGVDCSIIQPNQPCFLPNTIKDHASVIFNSYYQQNKRKGGSCIFNGAGLTTQVDPSHGSCHFNFIPRF